MLFCIKNVFKRKNYIYMKKFFVKKIISPAIAILIVIISISGTICVNTLLNLSHKIQYSNDYYYNQAVKDAMTIEPEEILPIVKIAKESDMVTFNDNNEVLLITWHKYPDSYINGQEVTLKYGTVWAFTDKEIAKWYDDNNDDVQDWELRFEQLIGLPTDTEYTHFTAMWIPLDSIKRPAYNYDVTKKIDAIKFSENADENFVEWFNSNIINSYFNSAYPWTRLGYTYDWADNGTEYGLSEFLVEKGTVATVEFTYSTEEFINWLDNK